jgi:hypothetical protein
MTIAKNIKSDSFFYIQALRKSFFYMMLKIKKWLTSSKLQANSERNK